MKIGGLQKLTLIDFPEKLAAVVFVTGCNFRCPFCFNRDLVLEKLPLIPEKEIFNFLKKRKKLLDGVVVSGGESTLQLDLDKFLKKVKSLGLSTMIETNGSNPTVLEKLLKAKLLDFVALDFKAPLDERYVKAVGKKKFDPKAVRKSLELIIESGVPFELRTTVVPGIHRKKELVDMAKQLKTLVSSIKYQVLSIRWYLQGFQPRTCLDPAFTKKKPYNRKKMEEFLKAVKKYIPGAELRET